MEEIIKEYSVSEIHRRMSANIQVRVRTKTFDRRVIQARWSPHAPYLLVQVDAERDIWYGVSNDDILYAMTIV